MLGAPSGAPSILGVVALRHFAAAFTVCVALSLLPAPSVALAATEREATIAVPVATLWTGPHPPRRGDLLSISASAFDYRSWVDRLTADDRLALVGRIETQALLGERVAVLKRGRAWSQVAVRAQPSPRSGLGYPGWIRSDQLRFDPPRARPSPRALQAVISSPAMILRKLGRRSRPLRISFDTRLPIARIEKRWLVVRLPTGERAVVKRAAAEIVAPGRAHEASASAIIATAKRFLGLRYIWGGASGFGFDCSGFVYRLFHASGITIPRDTGPLWQGGQPVSDPRPGDLIFFAHAGGQPPHHVGLYLGNNLMIHSPNSRSSVRIDSINSAPYGAEYLGMRRYLSG